MPDDKIVNYAVLADIMNEIMDEMLIDI